MTDETAAIVARMKEAAQKATPDNWDGKFAPNTCVNEDLTFGPLKWPVCVLSQVDGYPKHGAGLIAEAYSREAQDTLPSPIPPPYSP